jgi:hypothetical protein
VNPAENGSRNIGTKLAESSKNIEIMDKKRNFC